MANQNTQSSPHDQANGKFDRSVINREAMTTDDDEKSGSVKRNLNTKADTQVRQNEDASLQDDSYAFDEANTDNEEFHDIDDVGDDASDLTDLFESDDSQ